MNYFRKQMVFTIAILTIWLILFFVEAEDDEREDSLVEFGHSYYAEEKTNLGSINQIEQGND